MRICLHMKVVRNGPQFTSGRLTKLDVSSSLSRAFLDFPTPDT